MKRGNKLGWFSARWRCVSTNDGTAPLARRDHGIVIEQLLDESEIGWTELDITASKTQVLVCDSLNDRGERAGVAHDEHRGQCRGCE
jgi:hypothetical protein